MKNLSKLFYFFAFALVLNSCGNNDDNEDDSLVGDWTVIEFSTGVSNSGNAGGTDFSISSTIVGENLDYDLSFTQSAFTTSGSYDATATVTVDGMSQPASTTSYTGVSGNGTYSVDGDMITVGGSFFDFEVDGVDLTALGGQQTVQFEIDDSGTLIFTQNETQEINQSGTMLTTVITSTSKWVRQ